MGTVVDGFKYAWGLAVDGYSVCVAAIEKHNHAAFWLIAVLGLAHWVR